MAVIVLPRIRISGPSVRGVSERPVMIAAAPRIRRVVLEFSASVIAGFRSGLNRTSNGSCSANADVPTKQSENNGQNGAREFGHRSLPLQERQGSGARIVITDCDLTY